MQTVRLSEHQGVEMYEFGYSPIGKPVMTVFCYWIDGLLIDTAQANARRKVLKTFRDKHIEQIALTHWHEDHTGNVGVLQSQFDATVLAHPFTIQKTRESFKILPYEQFMFGKIPAAKGKFEEMPSEIKTEKYTLTPIHTPGHSIDHHVFLEKNKGWLFSGDLYVGIKIKYFRKGEDIYQQILSLKKLLQYDFEVIFCAHSPQFTDVKSLWKAKLQYFEDFYGQVAKWWQEGYKSRQIMKKMGLKEVHLVRLLTFDDVSLKYMVDSVVENEQRKELGDSE